MVLAPPPLTLIHYGKIILIILRIGLSTFGNKKCLYIKTTPNLFTLPDPPPPLAFFKININPPLLFIHFRGPILTQLSPFLWIKFHLFWMDLPQVFSCHLQVRKWFGNCVDQYLLWLLLSITGSCHIIRTSHYTLHTLHCTLHTLPTHYTHNSPHKTLKGKV